MREGDAITALERLSAGAGKRVVSAAAGLADLAAERGLIDVAVGALDSPVGRLTIAVTPKGLVRVAFEEEDRDRLLEELAASLSPRVLESPRRTQAWRRQLDEFFGAKRTGFDLRVDRSLVRGVQRDVLAATRRVPYGRVTTYGRIAAEIGRPKAARVVGWALGANPIPIVIPCHRVIGAKGALTGYGGGLERKAQLLALEGSLPPPLPADPSRPAVRLTRARGRRISEG